jgi:hypothetical protein
MSAQNSCKPCVIPLWQSQGLHVRLTLVRSNLVSSLRQCD